MFYKISGCTANDSVSTIRTLSNRYVCIWLWQYCSTPSKVLLRIHVCSELIPYFASLFRLLRFSVHVSHRLYSLSFSGMEIFFKSWNGPNLTYSGVWPDIPVRYPICNGYFIAPPAPLFPSFSGLYALVLWWSDLRGLVTGRKVRRGGWPGWPHYNLVLHSASRDLSRSGSQIVDLGGAVWSLCLSPALTVQWWHHAWRSWRQRF